MRLLLTTILALSTLEVVLACCGSKSTFSCCGKGKCNVFCCNCKGGCLPKDKCSPYSPPICWVFDGSIVCSEKRSLSLSSSNTSPNTTSPTPNTSLSIIRREILSGEEAMLYQKDAEQLAEVDTEGKGYFTFEQFVAYQGWEGGVEAKRLFDSYDKNGDGVIELEEMRLND